MSGLFSKLTTYKGSFKVQVRVCINNIMMVLSNLSHYLPRIFRVCNAVACGLTVYNVILNAYSERYHS